MGKTSSKSPRFVLSVPARLDPDGAEMLKFISEPFDALELPESILSSPGLDQNITAANLTDIVPKSVSRGLHLQSKTIKDEFRALLVKTFEKAKSRGINSLTLDLGLDDCPSNSPEYDKHVDLLKYLAPYLYRAETSIRLPARIPHVLKDTQTSVPEFIRDSMCGLFRMELDIHPHEILNSPPLEHIAKHRFMMDAVAFAYEPEAGNFLVEKLMEPWFAALKQIRFEGDVVFKPFVSSWESLDDAVDGLHSLLESIPSS